MSVTQPDLPSADAAADWPAAFALICDRHRGRLIRWLSAIFGARDAEDIAQEALARLYSRPGMIDTPGEAWPWLAVVARNVGRDMVRHNALSTTVDNDVLAAMPGSEAVPDQVIAREDAARLASAVRVLTPRERALIRLRDFEGAGIPELAEYLGINENAVRQQLYRARRRLAGAYVDLGGDRNLGLPALLGLRLRLRELIRQYGDKLDAFAASASTVLSVVAPSLAIATGALFGGAATATAAAGAAPGTVAASYDRDLGHGYAGGGRGWAPPGADGAARGVGGSTPRALMLSDHRDLGPATSDVRVYRSPFGRAAGTTDHERIEVLLPNGYGVTLDERGEKGEGSTVFCRSRFIYCG